MKKTPLYLALFVVVQALLLVYWIRYTGKQPRQIIYDTVKIISKGHDTVTHLVSYRSRLAEQAMLATLFQQRAAEYRALCYQAFNAARIMLDNDLKDPKVNSPRAIIVDLDETMLDNSPHTAKCIEEGVVYPAFWDEWCQLATAKAVPGALEFLNHTRRYGVNVFYVTNRKPHLKDVTMKNMRELGFPQVEDRHFMFRTAEASKESRRQELMKTYHISMLIGDNLADFSYVFENKPPDSRAQTTDSLAAWFGKRYIVLPNAMYGDWEAALYDYDHSLSDSAKVALRYQHLIAF